MKLTLEEKLENVKLHIEDGVPLYSSILWRFIESGEKRHL